MQAFHKSALLRIVLALMLLPVAFTIESPAVEEKEIRLQWAFGALTGPADNPQFLSISNNAVLHSGDRMKLFLQPQTDCHLYLFYRSSQQEWVVMLPAHGSGSRFTAGARITLPQGADWFRLDEVTGIETFYLLASARPLNTLEILCENLSAAAQPERSTVGRQILSEISRLQKKHRTLTAAAERPVRLGGNFRGMNKNIEPELPDISQIAMEISVADFFSRTFTIDHR